MSLDTSTPAEERPAAGLIAASFQRVLAESGPRQAEVLRRCAIPRWFDLGVLATLRERADGNERVLDLLRGYSFVREIGGGRYAYQDEVRAMLLAEWRASQPADLRAISQRLADHFAARETSPPPDQIALPAMTIMLRPPGEADLWQREALYHQLIADPAGGLDRLRAAFDQAEADYRLADAEALLQLTADAQLDQAGGRWVRYMRARIERAALRLDAAVSQLDALLAEPGLDARLAAEARQTLGETLTELGQWARATELYRASLDQFTQSGDRRRGAEVMLRLGEAYRGLGLNTGGWYVPAFSQHPIARALGRAWYGLLALPFVLAAAFLRHTPWALPRPQYAAPYQNWLLIRIYRTAQSWYERARAESAALGDALGQLRAEQQLAEVLLLFGYPEAALARLDELRARLAPQDSYRRLWVDNDRAAALIELGQIPTAQAILNETLAGFQTLGDERGQAAALALQGRAAADSGAADQALASYRDSLARFRALRYTAAREQALYALRAWQRQVGPGPISQAINQMLGQEPEKRYMARFPRSLLPQLQALVLGVVPLGLVLTALVAPTEVVRRVGDSAIVSSQMTYNLWNVVVVVLLLYLLSLTAYGLVALGLIFFIRLEAIEREQPDFLITDERGISRYDYHGALAQSLGWGEIRRWVQVDRKLWRRPMALFSLALLEAADGRDLRVDGIVGWYGGLQRDIDLHLRGAGNPAQAEPRGVDFLRGGWGAMLMIGAALLLLCISNDNSWTDWMVRLLGPAGYAAVALLGYSGALILIPLAYWLVTHPLALHRALGLDDHWPWFAGAGGLGAIGLALFGARLLPIDALRVALLLWGVYALAEALFTILFPRRGRLGAGLVAAALLATALLAASPLTSAYYDTLRATYARLADYASAAQVPLEGGQEAQAQQLEQLGNQLYLADRYREAIAAYTQAIRLLEPLADRPEIRQKIAVLTYNRAVTLRKLGLPNWEREFERACAQSEPLCGLAPR